MEHSGIARLLEREGELSELAGLIDDACAGRGRVLPLEGPPGIGKTRLREAARSLARERGMALLSARASELDIEFPFGIVRQLFEPLLASSDPPRRDRLLHGAAGLAQPLLDPGGRAGDPGDAGSDVSLARFHALYWLTANLAEEAPVGLVVDDVHWADSSSLRFLQFLIPRVEELPVLVALASRPPEPGADRKPIDALATDPLAHVLRPAPLSEQAVVELVAAELGESAHPAFCAACREATGGNPFLLRELLRELRADDVVPSEEGVPVVRQLAPPTVARAVLLRLARLGEHAAALARAVAVLGDGVPLRRACALAGLSDERGGEVAGALARADVL